MEKRKIITVGSQETELAQSLDFFLDPPPLFFTHFPADFRYLFFWRALRINKQASTKHTCHKSQDGPWAGVLFRVAILGEKKNA